MFAGVKAALRASGLQQFEQAFEEISLDDSVVEYLISNKDEMPYLVKVMPLAVDRFRFLAEYRKLQKPSSFPSKSQNLKLNGTPQSPEVITIDSDNDDDHDSGAFFVRSPSQESSFSSLNGSNNSSSSTSSQILRAEFNNSVKEAHDAAIKKYKDKMEGLSYDSPNLQSIHETNKQQALDTFVSCYGIYSNTAFEVVRLKTENDSLNDFQVKMEVEGQEDLSIMQQKLIEAIENNFQLLLQKSKLEQMKAQNAEVEAEKLYISEMSKCLEACLDESELIAKKAEIHRTATNYLSNNLQRSFVNSQLIQQLNKELDNFISSSFKSQLQLFRLKKEADEVVVQNALIAAKAFYNDEMEKYFTSGNYMEPSTLAQLDERVSSAAIKNILEQYKITLIQQAQLGEAMEKAFQKFKDRNLLRKPTKSPAIGIDLGGTYSCVAVVINGKVEVIRNENGHNTTPSYVAFQDDGSVVVGDAAKDQSYRNPQNTITDSKNLIGRKFDDPEVQENIKSYPFEVTNVNGKPKIQISNKNAGVNSSPTAKKMKLNVGCEESLVGNTFHPEEISAEILKRMKRMAENYLDIKVESAVVTVPALFNDSQRQATKDAAEIAGLKVLRIINEPTAAAIAYQLHRMDDITRNVLVFDLGGRTFDVAALKITGGEIDVQAVHGDTHLGGEDFDAEMVQVCIDHFKKNSGVDLTRGKESSDARERYFVSCRLRSIRNECEKQKRTLSCNETTVVHLDLIDSSHPTLDLHVPFTREMFETINQKYFDKCIEIVEKVLEEAEMNKSEINDIVLVGGSTRIPKIQKMLSNFFGGKKLTKTINPDESVAVGAAVQACILNGEKVTEFENSPLKLMDVNPFSIGIAETKDAFCVQIPKNSKIPCEKTGVCYIPKDYHTSILFRIYEGENPLASENNLLGSFVLTGIPPRKAWEVEVKTTTKVDEDGILSVQATCESINVTSDIKITAYKDRLSRKEIEEAKAPPSSST